MIIVLVWVVMETTADPVAILINYGGLVGAFVLLVLGRLHTTGEVDAQRRQIEAQQKTIQDRDDTIKAKDAVLESVQFQLTNRTVPALTRTSEVLEAIPQGEVMLTKLLRESLEQTAILMEQLNQLKNTKE